MLRRLRMTSLSKLNDIGESGTLFCMKSVNNFMDFSLGYLYNVYI